MPVRIGRIAWPLAKDAARPSSDRVHICSTIVSGMFSDWTELHGDRRFADDPALVCGFRAIPRTRRGNRRAPEGAGHQADDPPQLRHAQARGLPEGAARYAARRAFRQAGTHLRRHARCLPRPRRRGAGPGRGHRGEPARDGSHQGSDHRHDHGRGGKRRGTRHRRGRSGQHARALDLLGHLSRGVCVHPLA